MKNLLKGFLQSRWVFIFLISLTCVLVFLLILFVSDVRNLYMEGRLRPTPPLTHRRGLNREPFLPGDIQGWMTFKYVNFAFRLPKDYLASYLNIKGSSYPNLRINEYARDNNLDKANFLNRVRTAVVEYRPAGGGIK